MIIRDLAREDLDDLWSIDRAELIEAVYRKDGTRLVLAPELHRVAGWPEGEPEEYAPILLDCFDHGGSFYGAFEGSELAGAVILEGRFIGSGQDQLQLKFLHVGRRHRKTGLGETLFQRAVDRARALGAGQLYISATPSENTVSFYLRRGCRPTEDVDPALYKLEPADIHLVFDIPT